MALVKTGFVYKLVSKDINVTECYVGSTANITKRKYHHKHDCNNVNGKAYDFRVYQYIRENGGFENQDMVVLETVQYNDKYELKARERHHLELLGATLNTRTPGRIDAEWREENKEHVKQREKQYRQDNAEQIKQHKKQYCEQNKEQIKQQTTQKHDCQCGGKYTNSNKSSHMKSVKHQKYLN